jgi:acylphosphatase
MPDNVRAHVIISGRVQGVAFRMETQLAAERVGVTGWVRNRPDGTVEAALEGDKPKVEQMLQWCRRGPVLARVDAVDVRWKDFEGEFPDFRIVR